jgi:hypothetical protein
VLLRAARLRPATSSDSGFNRSGDNGWTALASPPTVHSVGSPSPCGVARSTAGQSRGSADGTQPFAIQRLASPRSTNTRHRSDVAAGIAGSAADRWPSVRSSPCEAAPTAARVPPRHPFRGAVPCAVPPQASVRRVRKERGPSASGEGFARAPARWFSHHASARGVRSLRGRGRSFDCVHGVILTPLGLDSPIRPRMCRGRWFARSGRGCPRGAGATHMIHPGAGRSICCVYSGRGGCDPCCGPPPPLRACLARLARSLSRARFASN